jgi:hypothetical protein
VPEHGSNAARGAKPGATRRQRHRDKLFDGRGWSEAMRRRPEVQQAWLEGRSGANGWQDFVGFVVTYRLKEIEAISFVKQFFC